MNEIISLLNELDPEVASTLIICAFFIVVGILVTLVICVMFITSVIEEKYHTQLILARKEK